MFRTLVCKKVIYVIIVAHGECAAINRNHLEPDTVDLKFVLIEAWTIGHDDGEDGGGAGGSVGDVDGGRAGGGAGHGEGVAADSGGDVVSTASYGIVTAAIDDVNRRALAHAYRHDGLAKVERRTIVHVKGETEAVILASVILDDAYTTEDTTEEWFGFPCTATNNAISVSRPCCWSRGIGLCGR